MRKFHQPKPTSNRRWWLDQAEIDPSELNVDHQHWSKTRPVRLLLRIETPLTRTHQCSKLEPSNESKFYSLRAMSQHPQRELFKDRFIHPFCQLWKLKQVVSGSISRAVYSTLPLSSTDFNETNPVRPGFQVCCELRLMNPIGAGPADWGGPNRPSLAFKSACCEFPLIKPIGAGLKATEPSR